MKNTVKSPLSPECKGNLWKTAGITLYLVCCACYVAFALTPSSYGQAFALLGLPTDQGLVLGASRAIRSDEWMVLTPYFQIAVANHFGPVNQFSPYHEFLRSFQALPILDWGIVFKPHLWGFFILPPANAYSLYFLLLANAFIAGWACFLRQLRMPPLASIAVSATLFYSPFIQAWWTSTAAAFAFAPWVALCWMCIKQRWLRIPAVAYVLTIWTVSFTYPPFLYGAALSMAVLTGCFRRDLVSPRTLADALVSAVIGASLSYLYFRHLIPIMQGTIYPGQRDVTAGGVPWQRLLSQLWPGITTHGYEPLVAQENANAVNITMLSSLLPVYALTLTDLRNTFRRACRENLLGTCIVAVTLLIVSCWTFLWFPSSLANLVGLSSVPPKRAMFIIGLILNIICAQALVRGKLNLSTRRLALLATITLVGTLLKPLLVPADRSEIYTWMDGVPWLCLAFIALHARLTRNPDQLTQSVLLAALLGNVLTFGLFNPVQSATPIFALDRESVRQHLFSAAGARTTADGTMVVSGHFGAILAGAGLPAINHVLYYPQLSFYRRYFPALPEAEFNALFNRYEHVSVSGSGEGKPRLVYMDHVQVPADAFLKGVHGNPVASPQPE
jgi:hypothetical protein